MKPINLTIATLLISASILKASDSTRFRLINKIDSAILSINQLYEDNVSTYTDFSDYPNSLDNLGALKTVEPTNWVSGFYPGCLWYVYELTGDERFKTSAINWTEGLHTNQYRTNTHDLGFIMYCSYGNGLRLTKNPSYKETLINTSESLISRYRHSVGAIRSWDWGSWEYPVIIDNMMNLELLQWAHKASDNIKYDTISRNHTNTTMLNHYRDNYSCYHVVDYNIATGNVISKETHQGYNDESEWGRGQSWGLYGYTMMYRETGNIAYLEFAYKIADYFIAQLPDDYIPYWDFLDPEIPDVPRDASAGAIAASAILELSRFSNDSSEYYLNIAENILEKLMSKHYMPEAGSIKPFILAHSTGHKPAEKDVDVPIIYADYYFLESLIRYKKLVAESVPKTINIELTTGFEEDTLLHNLYQHFKLSNTQQVQFTVENTDTIIDAFINNEYNLVISEINKYYDGETSIAVHAIPPTNDTITTTINITLVLDNFAPDPFNLISPADMSAFDSLVFTFNWEEAYDINEDDIKYELHVFTDNFDTTYTNIPVNRLDVDLTDILPPADTLWWEVSASDGQHTTTSNTYRILLFNNSPNQNRYSTKLNFTIFPNPVKEYITIHCPEEISYLLYDAFGRIVIPKSKGNHEPIYLGNLHGIYILQVQSPEHCAVQKILIKGAE